MDNKPEPERRSEPTPPAAVPAMPTTAGPPTAYAPTASTNPFVGHGYGQCENPYGTLTGLPPHVEASAPQPRTEQVEPRWPRMSAMFGLGGGYEYNLEPKPRKTGSGYPTLATLQANSSSAGLGSTPTLGTSTGFANTATPPSVESQGVSPMAACVHTSQTTVSLQELRKVKTTLPTIWCHPPYPVEQPN
eukprot:4361083-Amphidinium_carterae.2